MQANTHCWVVILLHPTCWQTIFCRKLSRWSSRHFDILKTNHGDWVEQLEKDKKEQNLQLTDDDVRTFSQEQFRKFIQEKIEQVAGKFLIEQRNSHFKSENLKCEGFKPASYLTSWNLTTKEVQTLFNLRSRMIDVKANFRSANLDNLWCKLCLLSPLNTVAPAWMSRSKN